MLDTGLARVPNLTRPCLSRRRFQNNQNRLQAWLSLRLSPSQSSEVGCIRWTFPNTKQNHSSVNKRTFKNSVRTLGGGIQVSGFSSSTAACTPARAWSVTTLRGTPALPANPCGLRRRAEGNTRQIAPDGKGVRSEVLKSWLVQYFEICPESRTQKCGG